VGEPGAGGNGGRGGLPAAPGPPPPGPALTGPLVTGPLPFAGGLAVPGGSQLTGLATGWLAESGSAETRRAYARELRRFLEWCAGSGVDPLAASRGDVAGYARSLERLLHRQPGGTAGLAPASRARALAAVSSFYSYAASTGVIAHSPAARVRRPRLDRDRSATVALTAAEARALLASAAADRHGPPGRSAALIGLLVSTGLRVGEAIRADVADLGYDRGHRILRVVRKGGRPGAVPVPPQALAALGAYLAARPDLAACRGSDGQPETSRAPAGAPLFTTGTGGRLAQSEVWRLVRRLARDAGLPAAAELSPHSLRATCATIARLNGAELADLQDLLGHADPRTTRRYDKARDNLDRSPAYAVAAVLGPG
jgi:integrase/recombinase XerD